MSMNSLGGSNHTSMHQALLRIMNKLNPKFSSGFDSIRDPQEHG
jgi:hypothetical protein